MEIRKQLIRFSLFVAFLFVMFLLPAAAPTAPAKGGASYTDEQLGAIARLTSRLFENSHYRPQALDTQFSHQLFDAYFDLLDPNHISFTAKDVAEFLPERDLLASNLKAGKVDFAFRVYDLFRRRNREFRIFDRAVWNIDRHHAYQMMRCLDLSDLGMFSISGKDHSVLCEFRVWLIHHKEDSMRICVVCCDMTPSYIRGITETFPKTSVVFDPYHIIQATNRIVEDIRRKSGL